MKIQLDGREISIEGEKTILAAAKEQGFFIPSLCDHPRLEPYAGCRLCLVEIKGRKGYSPACSTYAEEGMEVTTDSPALATLRRNLLSLLLSEHPNACLLCAEKPSCDDLKSALRKAGEVTGCVLCSKNGRCRLQDVVNSLRPAGLNVPSIYRGFEVIRSDPFFDRNYNLCILCGQCVRICSDVRGVSAITFISRGQEAVVGTPPGKTLLESGCRLCGACVDVCPTAALEERAVKPEPPPERTATTICPLCSLGCELEVGFRGQKIIATRPSEAGPVSRGQACVKGRFAVRDAVMSPSRLLDPKLRSGGRLLSVSWEEALTKVAAKLSAYKNGETVVIISPQSAIEDLYILNRFARLGLNARMGTLSGKNFASAALELSQEHNFHFPLNFKIREISEAKTIFVLGTDLALSHPIIWLEVFEALRKGAKLIMAHSGPITLERHASALFRIKPGSEGILLTALLETLEAEKTTSLPSSDLKPLTGMAKEDLKSLASELSSEKPVFMLLGPDVAAANPGKDILATAWNLGRILDARLIPLDRSINEKGLSEIERHFSSSWIEWEDILENIRSGQIKALYLAGPAPPLVDDKPEYLVCQAAYLDRNVLLADAVFPSSSFVEMGGGFVNIEGRVQTYEPAMDPLGKSKPDRWIITQLAAKMGLAGYESLSLDRIRQEMSEQCPGFRDVFQSTADSGCAPFMSEKPWAPGKFLSPGKVNVPSTPKSENSFLLRSSPGMMAYRELDLSQEIKGLRVLWDLSWIFMNGQDARALGIGEGNVIEIDSPCGRFHGRAKISESLFPGSVETAFPVSSPLYPKFMKAGVVNVTLRRIS